MYIKSDSDKHRGEIWVSNEERDTYKSTADYQTAVRNFGENGYRVCVYIGGTAPLLPNISALLRQNDTAAEIRG